MSSWFELKSFSSIAFVLTVNIFGCLKKNYVWKYFCFCWLPFHSCMLTLCMVLQGMDTPGDTMTISTPLWRQSTTPTTTRTAFRTSQNHQDTTQMSSSDDPMTCPLVSSTRTLVLYLNGKDAKTTK
jgi:hypothetical protein